MLPRWGKGEGGIRIKIRVGQQKERTERRGVRDGGRKEKKERKHRGREGSRAV